jgi:hypothetical protein
MMRKIEAIKIIRKHTGASLTDSKHAMEEIVALGVLADEQKAAERGESAAVNGDYEARRTVYDVTQRAERAEQKVALYQKAMHAALHGNYEAALRFVLAAA